MNIGLIVSPFMILMGGMYLLKHRNQVGGSYYPIGQEYAKGIMERERNYVIVDVRSPEEYHEAHVPGAINIPLPSISKTYCPDALQRFDQKILVYSGDENTGKIAAGKLAKLGYSDVNEFGSFTTWPYEVESDRTEEEAEHGAAE